MLGGATGAGKSILLQTLVTSLLEVARRQIGRLGGGATTGGQRNPWTVVIVDGWEQFENRGDPTLLETSLLTTLRETIVAGLLLGVHVVPLGGQELLTSRVAALFTRPACARALWRRDADPLRPAPLPRPRRQRNHDKRRPAAAPPTSPVVAREHGFKLEPDQSFAAPPTRSHLTLLPAQPTTACSSAQWSCLPAG